MKFVRSRRVVNGHMIAHTLISAHFYFSKKELDHFHLPAVSESELDIIRVSISEKKKKRTCWNRGFPRLWLVQFYLFDIDRLREETCLRARVWKFSGIEPWQSVGIARRRRESGEKRVRARRRWDAGYCQRCSLNET